MAVHGIIYALKSPSFEKFFIGGTTGNLNQKIARHIYSANNGFNSSANEIILKRNYKVEILHEGDFENLTEFKRRQGEIEAENKDKIVNIKRTGRTNREYQFDYYHNVIKPNRLDKDEAVDSGKYRQLQRYRDNRYDLLRRAALRNARAFQRRPTQTTIEKYELTEEEILQAIEGA